MPDHKILVTVDEDGDYVYTDIHSDDTVADGSEDHVKNNENIQWGSSLGDLTITFTGKNPTNGPASFTVPAGKFSSKVRLNGKKGEKDKYSAQIQGYAEDDPMIIFDDDGGPQSGVVGHQDLTGTAADVVNDVLSALGHPAPHDGQVRPRDPKSLFFPHGINSIAVNVTAGTVGVSLTMSGPNSEK